MKYLLVFVLLMAVSCAPTIKGHTTVNDFYRKQVIDNPSLIIAPFSNQTAFGEGVILPNGEKATEKAVYELVCSTLSKSFNQYSSIKKVSSGTYNSTPVFTEKRMPVKNNPDFTILFPTHNFIVELSPTQNDFILLISNFQISKFSKTEYSSRPMVFKTSGGLMTPLGYSISSKNKNYVYTTCDFAIWDAKNMKFVSYGEFYATVPSELNDKKWSSIMDGFAKHIVKDTPFKIK